VNKLRTLPGKMTKIWAVGDRAHALLADSVWPRLDCYRFRPQSMPFTPLVGQTLIDIEAASRARQFVEVYVFHNQPEIRTLRKPLQAACCRSMILGKTRLASLPWPTKSLPEVIEGAHFCASCFSFEDTSLFCSFKRAPNLLPVKTPAVWRRCQRRKDIEEHSGDLNRTLHRVRQESIDEELFDVVSGFEALTGRGAPA